MSPALRRVALLVHIAASVGWFGAVVAFLALAIVGMTNADPSTARGAYLVMEPAARYALLPLAVASLVSGVIQSLGTTWGLFQHAWVVCKLLLNTLALAILLIYMQTFREMAAVAADPAADLAAIRNPSPALHAVLAMVVLLLATTLGIYKPVRSQWIYASGATVALMVLMVMVHLAGGGPHGH